MGLFYFRLICHFLVGGPLRSELENIVDFCII